MAWTIELADEAVRDLRRLDWKTAWNSSVPTSARPSVSVPAVRQAIENWRHGSNSIRTLISSLQTLAGPECHSYIAEILVDSHPQVQKEILSGILPRSNDLAVVTAVTRLAESTPDPAVKEFAEKYLALARPG